MKDRPDKSLQPTRGGALGSSGSHEFFNVAVPVWLSSSTGLLWAALVVLCSSCGAPPKPQTSLDISLRNDTAVALDWVKLAWDGPYVPGGILSPTVSKMAVGCPPPSSETAEVSFVEDQGRKPHSIKLNVAALKGLPAGKHAVVFSITSLDQARVLVDAQPK